MAKFKVEIEGLGELAAALANASSEARAGIEQAVGDEAEAIGDDMRANAPVGDAGVGRRGDPPLRESIEVTHEGASGSVGSIAEHAPFVEDGTSSHPAQPFARPAAEVSRAGRFEQRVSDAVRDRIT